jgi:uncharacterized protein (UPF0548 family)
MRRDPTVAADRSGDGEGNTPLCKGGPVFVLGRPSDDRLARTLAAVRGTPLTYPDVGLTAELGAAGGAGAAAPDGYRTVQAARTIGAGDADFAAACDGIRTWQLHRRQGFTVAPSAPPVVTGTEVVTAVPLAGPVHVLAACRIVWTVDDPGRVGFAYGTLAVHPACGEEAFVVERTPEGEVRARVVAFSLPHHLLVRLGGPVARRQQARATEGYLDALEQHVRAART